MVEESTILLDSPADLDATPVITFLQRTDHPVEVCHGPAEGTLCPIVGGGTCPRVQNAHGVIYHLDLDRPQHRAILNAYRNTLAADIPLRVVVQPGQEKTYAELLRGLPVWTHDPSTEELQGFAALVEAADYIREREAG